MAVRQNALMRAGLLATVTAVAMVCCTPASAQTRTFNVPAESASKAVATLAKQGNVQILLPGRTAKGVVTKAVIGAMSIERALATMLEGTGLHAQKSGATTWIIVPLDVAGAEGRESSRRGQESPGAGAVDSDVAVPDGQQDIVVTGTNIRGGTNKTSEVIRITRQEIEQSPYASTSDLLRSIPQTFSGGAFGSGQEGTLGIGSQAGNNNEHATAINLRGLGENATLTLINGHRVASSDFGNIVDISQIPISAIERVDIIADGASAVYGTDAVAGVVNFVLKKNYNGIEANAQVGTATDGALGQQVISLYASGETRLVVR